MIDRFEELSDFEDLRKESKESDWVERNLYIGLDGVFGEDGEFSRWFRGKDGKASELSPRTSLLPFPFFPNPYLLSSTL